MRLTLPSAHWKVALRNRVEQRYFEGSHDMAWRLRERVNVGLEAGYLHQHLDRTPARAAHVIFASLAFRLRPPSPAW